MDTIISKLPDVIPATRVIQADGCEQVGDGLHFAPAGYWELGRRYAREMLSILGYSVIE